MGLSVYYSATICSHKAITALIEETTDNAESLSCKYTTIDEEIPAAALADRIETLLRKEFYNL